MTYHYEGRHYESRREGLTDLAARPGSASPALSQAPPEPTRLRLP